MCPPTVEIPTKDLAADLSIQESARIRQYPPVLTYEVLEEIWADMRDTLIPSWMTRAPRNFGTAGHGKLTADQWRTVCTVNAVITLGRLFGSRESSTFHKAVLDNFFALVVAVRMATMRSTSEDRVSIVERSFVHYMKTLVPLYSQTPNDIHPNQHLSLHLPECLRAFGPVHGWWAFPFERFNGALQRTNTNKKSGNHVKLLFLDSCT